MNEILKIDPLESMTENNKLGLIFTNAYIATLPTPHSTFFSITRLTRRETYNLHYEKVRDATHHTELSSHSSCN